MNAEKLKEFQTDLGLLMMRYGISGVVGFCFDKETESYETIGVYNIVDTQTQITCNILTHKISEIVREVVPISKALTEGVEIIMNKDNRNCEQL